ncbi:hypothetical protein PAXRUDRAFT_826982 [Paxillus rubicundulus Ve08.2h10]|uniref:Uncharacterized protein n=1 Tax=Paxillus rubicundulus Ve08.2h10 TaxID=930991 RepID=A0A0D0DYW8_9AGAM|nr:hypothetical protein PAXRUDRAFT_826982 [Paxillus rubicundulus Ve08.2h10]
MMYDMVLSPICPSLNHKSQRTHTRFDFRLPNCEMPSWITKLGSWVSDMHAKGRITKAQISAYEKKNRQRWGK